MKFVAAIVLLLAACLTMLAQPGGAANRPVRSMTGQFVVSVAGWESAPGAKPGPVRSNPNLVTLEPSFLAVSCERMKQALYADLDVTTPSRGIVYITIRPRRGPDREFDYTTERFSDNWIYRLELPPQVERQRLVRVIVRVLLQEMANRTAGNHLAEIPAWLAEGFAQQLLNSREVELILSPPTQSLGAVMLGATNIQARLRDPLETAREVLRDHAPLSIAELSWPGPNQLEGEAGGVFRGSAQLFVTELLALNQGQESLRAMINTLAGCYNWQTAFLRAFAPQFPNLLAVEKWWTLQVVHFVGRDPMHLWTTAESWQQLADVLHTSVAVRRTTHELPAHLDVTLQTVLRDWEPARQLPALRGKINELEMAQQRVAPPFIGLVSDYRRVLGNYVQQHDRATSTLGKLWLFTPSVGTVVRETVQQLDELDQQRAALRPKPENAVAVPAATSRR